MGKRVLPIYFEKVKVLLTARSMPIDIRKRFVICFIGSVVLYGSET